VFDLNIIRDRPRAPRPDAPVSMRACCDIELARKSVATAEVFKVPPWIGQKLYLAGKAYPIDSGDLLRMALVRGPQPR
jgi:hypothetical protein